MIASTPPVKTVVLGLRWFHGEPVSQTIDLIKSLVVEGKKVVVIGVLPPPNIDIPKRLHQLQLLGQNKSDIVGPINQDRYFELNNYVQAQLASQIALGQVVWIDATKHFCYQKECFYAQGGVANLMDSNHIAQAKALEFVDEFKHALKD